jgi:hypothetical protein
VVVFLYSILAISLLSMTESAEAAAAIDDDRSQFRLSHRERLRRILVCSLIPIVVIAGYLEYPSLLAEYHFYKAEQARLRAILLKHAATCS